MKLLLFGNVGCGKSAISLEILKTYSDFNILNIDNFRREFGDGSMEKEILAKRQFIQAIDKNNENQIIECSGLGDTGEMLIERLLKSKDNKIVVVLLTEPSICIERLKNRIWDIPYPDKTSNVNKLIEKQNSIYQSNLLKVEWQNLENVIFIDCINNNKDDYQLNCQKIKSIINETKSNN